MIKRGLYYFTCLIFILNLLPWVSWGINKVVYGSCSNSVEFFSYVFLVFTPVIISALLYRMLKWKIYKVFGVEHYYAPFIKQLKKLMIGDKILVADRAPFKDEQVFTVTDVLMHARCFLNTRFIKNFSKSYELTGREGDKIMLSLVSQNKIKFSKRINKKDFFNLILPLTEYELSKIVRKRESFSVRKTLTHYLNNWIYSGEQILKSEKVAYLKENMKNSYGANIYPKLKTEDFYYCYVSRFVVDSRRTRDRDYYFEIDFDTGFEINIRNNMVDDVFMTYTTDTLNYKDYIFVNPKMEDIELFRSDCGTIF